jgi:hypothetical protein
MLISSPDVPQQLLWLLISASRVQGTPEEALYMRIPE